eukprot:1415743-Prymnesium_polylepis.1
MLVDEKNVQLPNVWVELLGGVTLTATCSAQLPPSTSVAILTVLLLCIVRLEMKTSMIWGILLPFVLQGERFRDRRQILSRKEDNTDLERPYGNLYIMMADHVINFGLLSFTFAINACLVFGSESVEDVVLNSLALEFILEIDDQIKAALFSKRGDAITSSLDGSRNELVGINKYHKYWKSVLPATDCTFICHAHQHRAHTAAHTPRTSRSAASVADRPYQGGRIIVSAFLGQDVAQRPPRTLQSFSSTCT